MGSKDLLTPWHHGCFLFLIKRNHDCIVFIDEGNHFVMSDEFAATIQNTDNYYVIVTREGASFYPDYVSLHLVVAE